MLGNTFCAILSLSFKALKKTKEKVKNMRILIVSDTHGSVERVYEVYKKLAADSPVDLIVHCGDYADDAAKIMRHLGKKVLWVRGNCDGCFDEKEFAILETEAGNFFVCHGHMQNIGYSKQDLYYYAAQEDCIGVIYGHTHRADKTELGDFVFINPGSLTRPRDGSGGTFALLNTSEGHKDVRILRYNDFITDGTGKDIKKKVKGGHLRDLLNYSDGF